MAKRKRRDVYSLMSAAERRHMHEDAGCSNAAAVKRTLRHALKLGDEWRDRADRDQPFHGCHDCLCIARKVQRTKPELLS